MPRPPSNPYVVLSTQGTLLFNYAIPNPNYGGRKDKGGECLNGDRPLNTPSTLVRASFTATNTSPGPVAIKIKTSVPSARCQIRPTVAAISTGGHVEIKVALKLDGSLNGNEHYFKL